MTSTTNDESSLFEAAADAIVAGDIARLTLLLHDNAELVRQRSSSEHRSTLLHYVSANGVEEFRQKTPPNIVAVAELLLNSGADVNAESEAYGGHSTTLALTATSCHPENAGVQIPLMELLLARGAIFDVPGAGSIVNSCLRNGRGTAAAFLAGRGAQLDLEGAAGVGRLDLTQSLFASATAEQRKYALTWAAEYGHNDVVAFLLSTGELTADTVLPHGTTALHWASLGARVETVQLLLKENARPDIQEERWGGTPLGWAQHGQANDADGRRQPQFAEVIRLLMLTIVAAFGLSAQDGARIFRIEPVHPVEQLRSQALAAQPPVETGTFRPSDLVDIAKLDSRIRLDIRYASADDFLSTPVYTSARAFLQRPAAEALLRAHRELTRRGYGLLIFDAYRPWYVTKIFWDATPADKHEFVANPAQGSRHNRGCAVDLTLYDLKTGEEIAMPGVYDEMSERSYPNYAGGTPEQRAHRGILRAAMEKEGFTVFDTEWWHFDYKDWRQYRLQNIRFEDVR